MDTGVKAYRPPRTVSHNKAPADNASVYISDDYDKTIEALRLQYEATKKQIKDEYNKIKDGPQSHFHSSTLPVDNGGEASSGHSFMTDQARKAEGTFEEKAGRAKAKSGWENLKDKVGKVLADVRSYWS